ncbi:MAG TPA: biopolymer transporter ExbD [Candidatus Acidoferrales bacterium]|nr:biopolymer transporter ExbD [Candidatus Acidoferrales bacterium]
MAFSARHGSRKGIVAEINITPLTDIFLVLLIIFMVTSAAMVESGAKISLPQVDSTASQPREITITVTPNNDIYVNSQLTPYEELENALRALVSARPDIPVVLEGDREVLFGQAVRILSIAQKAGATQIAIAAERRQAQ